MNIIINNREYNMPLGKLYSKKTKKEIINLNEMNNYENVYDLFSFLTNSVTITSGDYYIERTLIDELNEIKKRIYIVDKSQEFLYKNGKVEKSINQMKDFITIILLHFDKVKKSEDTKKGGL